MKRLVLFLLLAFSCTHAQAISARYLLYIHYVAGGQVKVDIYDPSGDTRRGLSVAETQTFLKQIPHIPPIARFAVVTEAYETAAYVAVLKTILDGAPDMELDYFGGFGADGMEEGIDRLVREWKKTPVAAAQ